MCVKAAQVLVTVAVIVALSLSVSLREAHALVCSTTFNVEVTVIPSEWTDCSGTTNVARVAVGALFLEYDTIYELFQGDTLVSDFHITFADGQVRAIDDAEFSVGIGEDMLVWGVEIVGLSVWFPAPQFLSRSEPPDDSAWWSGFNRHG